MRFVEIRRHSVRDRPDEHLSPAGRALAAEVGRSRGPFRSVVSSPKRRAIETAEAMGFPPTAVSAVWGELDGVEWPLSFAEYHRLVTIDRTARSVADSLRAAVAALIRDLSDGERALVVTHGGVPELTAAGFASPETAHRLGPPCRCFEGIELGFDGDRYASVTSLRVPPERSRL